MSTALAAYDLDREKIDLIKQTVAKGATDLELDLFLHACKRTGLDPLMKQIYAIKRWNAKAGKEEMAIQTGIDGYRLIADRTGQYAGSDEATYLLGDDGFPDVASVTVYKLVGGLRCPFGSSARWKEYCQMNKEGKPTSMWHKMPFLMLAKCAEALALRKAFPAELSGVYTHEEMMQADAPEPAGKTSDQKFTAISNAPKPEAPKKDFEQTFSVHQVPGLKAQIVSSFAEKFPEQAKAIQEKLRQGDGLGALAAALPSAATGSQDAPASSLLPPANAWVIPFGKNKGKLLCDVTDGDVDYLLAYYIGKLNDPANVTSRYREEWESAVMEVRAEQLRRYPNAEA